VLLGQGKTVGEAVKTIGVTETTYHRWRNEYGGLKLQWLAISRLTLRRILSGSVAFLASEI
jgi:hypothetical protein